MSDDGKMPLPNLDTEVDVRDPPAGTALASSADSESVSKGAADLEAIFDVPVQVSAVLGRSRMDVGQLLKIGPGTVLELDRKVGEAIDIYVNDRLVARGEVVLVEDKLGVTMTEIIKSERG
ncbi:MAG: flagellar motor switch protein FliN [Xanthobacteraceae bacterium]